MVELTRFLACWPDVLAQECPFPNDWSNPRNFSDTPGDPGGATMDGIIQVEFDAYCTVNGFVHTSVQNVTKQEGQNIYVNNYWLPHCPSLPVGMDLAYFDADVNEGPGEATRILQVTLGIENDGIWGPETSAAVAHIPDVIATINAFTARRKIVYTETSGFQLFGRDWLRRAAEIGAEAVAMATTPMLNTKSGLWRGNIHVPRARFYLPKERQ